MRGARARSAETTAAARPYFVMLASASASSSSRNVVIGATGPKISSSKAAIPGVTPVMTVGSKKSPWREPPVRTFALGDRLGEDPVDIGGLTLVDNRPDLHPLVEW